MTDITQKDVSLYELALSCEQSVHPLQVSPTIFKSMLGTVIDFLLEEQLPATLWMKLPRGALWQAEVNRLYEMANVPYIVYLLKNANSDETEPSSAATAHRNGAGLEADAALELETDLDDPEADTPSSFEGSDDFFDDLTAIQAQTIEQGTKIVLTLAPNSQLRREYFVLAQTAPLSILMLAHRPRSVRSSQSSEPLLGTNAPLLMRMSIKEVNDAGAPASLKHPLLGICSFQAQTIHHVFDGIRQAIASGQASGEPSPDASYVLEHWDTLASQIVDDPDLGLVGRFFNRQIQRQEDLWRNSAAARQKAAMVSELQLLNEELLNANRLKDEFLQTVGQQLRTPLSSMKTALTLLNSPNLKPPQRQRYMDLLTQECDRQSSLITGVLDLLQLEHAAEDTPMQPLRLVDVVPAVVSTYQPLAQEKGVMLAYTIPDDLPAVSCASAWLRQIVINLLHNGIKFTPTGGQVWVTASQQGDYVQIEFRDTGIGIPSAEIPKIFERFYKARQMSDEDSSGVGLGLSIVQQLLLNCGGSISVKSKVGEGSSFNILLPIYARQ